jgi:lysophospholipase L1-like esterase/N-acetylglutamate synthase-like GNAT family acetyltransferase
MTNPDIRICFIGDSFTAGVGDPEALGWVGRVMANAQARGHNLTAYNLGVRRETSADILRRWRRECEPRVMPGTEMRVVFCFGANDTALDNGHRRLTLQQSLANTRALLREAKTRYPTLLIGPPPVADAAHDERIDELSRELAKVAREENVPCLDVFTPLMATALWREEAIANDGSHPRSGGYKELAELVTGWPQWWFHHPTATNKHRVLAAHVIRPAESDQEIDDCFPVMAQLRPHLARNEFVARVRRQMADGYRLVYLLEDNTVRAVAGYRIGENLAWERFLYVDDLVTDESRRSRGCGKALLAWLEREARRLNCVQLHLDSRSQRKDAHRFYLRAGMNLAGYHFAQEVGEQ